MAELLHLPFLWDGGEDVGLVVDRHGLGHHPPDVPGVGGQQDGGALLGQLPEGGHVLLGYGQTGRGPTVLVAESLQRLERLEIPKLQTVGFLIVLDFSSENVY